MLERLLYLHPALDRLIAFEKKLGPAGFKLTPEDWDLIERLVAILSIFVKVTKKVSAIKYPTLYFQLPFFTYLLRQLNEIIDSIEKGEVGEHEILNKACKECWEVLNTYWQKTDNHSSQAISLILDPRCKMDTFDHLVWNNSWKATAKRHLERVYQSRYYKPNQINHIVEDQVDSSDTDDEFNDILFGPQASQPSELPQQPRGRGRPSAAPAEPNGPPAAREITQYLAEKTEDRKVNPV